MTVINGQVANQTTFNGAFMSRTIKALGVGIEIDSTTEFSRPYPKMTTAQRDLIAAVEADCLYNLDTKRLEVYDGTAWGIYDNVDSVNGYTGTVVLDPDDLDDTATTNKFVTQAEKDKLAAIEDGAQVNTVDSVNGETGAVVLDKTHVGLGNVDNTSDADKPVSTAGQTALDLKADASDLTAHENDLANPHVVTKTQIGLGSVDNLSLQTHQDNYLAHKEVDTKANLVTWALTAINGSFAFATDEKKSYQVIDTLLAEIGGGAGGGGAEVPSTYKLFNAEDGDVTGFTNITINATAPINGEADYEVTAYPASFSAISTVPRNLGKRNTVTIQYTITSGTAKIAISGGGMLNPVGGEIDNQKQVIVLEYAPVDATDLTLTITDVSSATGLKLDDLEFSDSAREVKNFTVTETVEYLGYTSKNGSNQVLLPTVRKDTSSELITVTNTDHTRFTFKKVATFTCVAGYNLSTNQLVIVELYNSGGTLLKRGFETSGAAGTATATMIGEADVGDYLTYYANGASSNTNSTNFSVTATAQSSGTVFASDSNFENTFTAKVIDSTSGTISSYGEGVTVFTLKTHNSVGFDTYSLDTSLYSEFPTFSVVPNSTTWGDLTVTVKELTFPDFQVIRYSTGTTPRDSGFNLSVKNYGSDYKSKANYIASLIIENPDGEELIAFVEDHKTSGTHGGTSSITPVARDLNTLSGDALQMGVSIDGTDGFKFAQEGKYLIEWSAPAREANRHKTALRNETTATNLKDGSNEFTGPYAVFTRSVGSWTGEVASGTVFSILHEVQTSKATTGWGVEVGGTLTIGTSEVYTKVKITRIAKKLGVDQLGQVVTNHVTGGTEYELKGQLWNGKQIYARSYELASDIVATTTIDTIDFPLDILDAPKIDTTDFLIVGTSTSSGTRHRVMYENDTGAIKVRAEGGTYKAGSRFTIKYLKP